METDNNFKCVLCGESFNGWGNNAEPLAHGTCCDFCNAEVLLARIEQIKKDR